MAYHWLLTTCIIYMTSAIITPIQSQSNHLSNKLKHGTKPWFNRHSMLSRVPPRRLIIINRPRPQADILSVAADNHDDIVPSTFFDDVEAVVRQELSAAALEFYDTLAPDVIGFVGSAVAFQALVDNAFDPDELDIDEIAQEIAELLQDAYDNEADCRPLLEDFDDFLSILDDFDNFVDPGDDLDDDLRRRRLQDIVDGLLDFYNLVYDLFRWELTDDQLEFLEMEFGEGLDSIILGQGLLALFEADCIIDDASALQTVTTLLDVFMEFLDGVNGVADDPADDDDDDDDDDDESGESGDDAKSVNEAEDDLDLDIEQNEDGSEVVTLEMATSTMTNMWIALIVFCGFNMSLFWFFMARKKKQSVHYETAEDVPSVHH